MINRFSICVVLVFSFAVYVAAIEVYVPDDFDTFAEALDYLDGYGGAHAIILNESGHLEDFAVTSGDWSSLTIDGNGSMGEESEGDITLSSGPVTITNFELYGYDNYIYCLPGSDGSSIQGNLFWAGGIVVEDATDITISGNSIWYIDPAVTVKGSGNATITGNYLGIMGNKTGVLIRDDATATIIGNAFDANPIVDADTSSGNLVIEGNYRGGYGGGIIYDVSAPNDAGTIRGNTIEYSLSTGLHIVDGSPLVEGNAIVDGYTFGIVVGANANPDFGGGARGSTGNNTIYGNNGGDIGIDIKNNSPKNIYCEDNNWDYATLVQMSGHDYSDTDVDPAIWDHWEDSGKGYIMWDDPGPIGVKSYSLGQVKAAFSGTD